jgi:hypothetical protein
MGHCRRYWVVVAVIGSGCALVVRPRHQQLLYSAASASGPLSFPFNRRTRLGDDLGLRETSARVRGVHMHEYWWMHAGDAAVRFSWKLLWSWRR